MEEDFDIYMFSPKTVKRKVYRYTPAVLSSKPA